MYIPLSIYQIFFIFTCTPPSSRLSRLNILSLSSVNCWCPDVCLCYGRYSACFAGGVSLCCPIACWQGVGSMQLGMCRAINTLPLLLLRPMAERCIGLYLICSFSLLSTSERSLSGLACKWWISVDCMWQSSLIRLVDFSK